MGEDPDYIDFITLRIPRIHYVTSNCCKVLCALGGAEPQAIQ